MNSADPINKRKKALIMCLILLYCNILIIQYTLMDPKLNFFQGGTLYYNNIILV